jgi:hypothetical protein
MSYATLSQLKAALRVPSSDTVDDSTLQLALDAASEAIIVHCGRTFGTAATDTSRVFAAGKADVVEVDDLSSITAVYFSDDGSTWNITTDYQAEPLNGISDGIAFPTTRLRTTNAFTWPVRGGLQTVKVTGKFAFGSIPTSVKQAEIMQAIRWFKRPDAPFGVTFGEMGGLRVSRVDPDIASMLEPYTRPRMAL